MSQLIESGAAGPAEDGRGAGMGLARRLGRFADGFAPQRATPTHELVVRVRVIVFSCFGMAAASLALLPKALHMPEPHHATAWTLGLAGLFVGGLPVLMRYLGSARLAATLMLAAQVVAIGAMTYLNGGLVSAALAWALPAPLMAAFLLGTRAGAVAATVMLAMVSAFFALHRVGVTFPQPNSVSELQWWHFAGFSSATAFVLAVSLLFLHERRRAEAKLEGEARFAAESPSPVLRVDREGLILYANPAAIELLRCWSRGVGDRLPEAMLKEVRRTWEMSRVRVVECACDGQTYEVAIRILATEGYANLYGTNVTVRKAMQDRLALSDRLASLGTLAAGVAHEVNNPLTYVETNLSFVREMLAGAAPELPIGDATAAELVQALAEAGQGAERVHRIAQDMKLMARTDDVVEGQADLPALLDSALNVAGNEVKHRARVVKRYGETPPVKGSPARLGQVMLHLVLNAAQAIEEGAPEDNEITLTTRVSETGRVVVEIQDTGRGVPPDVLNRVFDPFFTTKPQGQGLGLGLSVCHGIVTQLGGELWLESGSDQGTRAVVMLPAASPEPAEPATASGSQAAA
ncbi:MAG: hypothetical protein IT371_19575 [Deltaproteobacteria bacterium]|nr:hypothetical protein [Deltaproteobacteria bacterium]